MGNVPSISKTTTPYIHMGAADGTSEDLTKRPGLLNRGGNDCWANSLLQTMATSPALVHIVTFIKDFFTSQSDANIRRVLDRNPNSIADIKRAAVQLERQLFTLIEDRGSHRELSTADTASLRRALMYLLTTTNSHGAPRSPISTSGQHDSYEVLQLLFGLYERCHTIQEPTEEHPLCYFTLKEATRFAATDHTYPIEEYRGMSREERIRFSRQHPMHSDALSVMNEECLIEKTNQSNILLFEILPLQEAICQLKREQSTLSREQKIEREDLIFSQFIQMRFSAQVPEESEELQALDPYDTLRGYRPLTKACSLERSPDELFLNVTRFDSFQRKIKDHTGQDLQLPIKETFTMPAEYVGDRSTYSLDSFIVHKGNVGGGHYYSYQKIDGTWYQFNDSAVSIPTVSTFERDLRESYLLHYRKLQIVDEGAFVIPIAERPVPVEVRIPAAGGPGRAAPSFDTLTAPETFYAQKMAERNQLETWTAKYKEGDHSFDGLPEKFAHKLFELVWVRDNMPQEWDYGRNKAQRDPKCLTDPCPPLIYPYGNNLLEQLLENEQAELDLLRAQSELASLQRINSLFCSGSSPREALRAAFEQISDINKEFLIDTIAREEGRFKATIELHGQPRFGQDAVEKDITILKHILEDLQRTENLYTGLDLSVFQNPAIRLLINQEAPSKEALQAEFDKLTLDEKNHIYGLAYHREINLRALAYAQRKIDSNIGCISTKCIGASISPLGALLERCCEACSEVQETHKLIKSAHRDSLGSSTLSIEQIEYIKRKM